MFDEPVGIRSIATYVPAQRMTAEDIARKTGGRWSAQAVKGKLGIEQKAVPGVDDGAQEMGAKAALACLKRGGMHAEEVDAIVCIGDELREYPMTTSGIYIQERIGARRAWAVDVMQKCSSFPAGVRIARALLRSERGLRNVLIAGGYRNGDLIDYKNPRVSFMYNLAPGGGAALLERSCPRNEILGVSLISDGALSRHVLARYGGTAAPVTADVALDAQHCLDVTDQEGMRELLAERSHPNFLKVVREALAEGDLTTNELDYLAILHMKRSAHLGLLEDLGLREDQSTYLSQYGHMGQFDQILSMQLGLAAGRIKDGSVVVGVGAGIGYSWGAVALRWGARQVRQRQEIHYA